MGANTGDALTTGARNTVAIGGDALGANTKSNNVAVGMQALRSQNQVQVQILVIQLWDTKQVYNLSTGTANTLIGGF